MQPAIDSVIDAIGATPLVRLKRLTRGLEGSILAKLDYLNPGFSKKDRIARQIHREKPGGIGAKNTDPIVSWYVWL